MEINSTLYSVHILNIFCVCAAEVSNLLVVTKDREQAPQKPMVTFDRILKEDLEQVRHLNSCLFQMLQ